MFMFNNAISALGLIEIILQGRKYTWSNMQPNPLLQKLDWVFTSSAWNISYPNTATKGLEMTPSDHCPCIISVSTKIPRPKIFRFENYWLELQDFQELLNQAWLPPVLQADSAKIITAKFKRLRRVLREKQATMSSIKTLIANIKLLIQFLETMEEYIDLSLPE